jgi:DNA sulfur modification protein DndC
LADISNYLIETRDNPEIYREQRRRNGELKEGIWGPYKFETRVEILKRVLQAQKAIEASEGIELITQQEMVLIQYHWFRDSFFRTKVSQIYNKIYKKQMDMSKHDEKHKVEEELLKKSCNNEMKDVLLIQDLLALQKTKTLMLRKRGLQADIDNRLNQYIEESKSSDDN